MLALLARAFSNRHQSVDPQKNNCQRSHVKCPVSRGAQLIVLYLAQGYNAGSISGSCRLEFSRDPHIHPHCVSTGKEIRRQSCKFQNLFHNLCKTNESNNGCLQVGHLYSSTKRGGLRFDLVTRRIKPMLLLRQKTERSLQHSYRQIGRMFLMPRPRI